MGTRCPYAAAAIVSKQKRRFTENGYNLDLVYITDHIIAMGAPSKGTTGLYRNSMANVQRFLKQRHGHSYCVYNLCSEEAYTYKPQSFERVANFPFDDHQVPALGLMKAFCEHVDAFLKEAPHRVAVVHCKAGKGRTGVMICAYLVYSGQCSSVDEAFRFYAERRTYNGKGITNASQMRYVRYFAAALAAWPPQREVSLCAAHLTGRGILKGSAFALVVRCRPTGAAAAEKVAVFPIGREEAALQPACCLEGDVRLEVHRVSWVTGRRTRALYSVWLHTGFLQPGQVVLNRPELDKVKSVVPHLATLFLTFSEGPAPAAAAATA